MDFIIYGVLVNGGGESQQHFLGTSLGVDWLYSKTSNAAVENMELNWQYNLDSFFNQLMSHLIFKA